MTKTSEPKIKFFDGEDFTSVTFQPDLAKFKMEKLDKDIVALLTRRAYDIAGSCKGVKVTLNGKKLPVSIKYFCLFYCTSFALFLSLYQCVIFTDERCIFVFWLTMLYYYTN